MARIAIVGGGVGGLCAAHAVAAAGHEAVVIERSTADATRGAALVLWPNAVHALDALGHGEAVRAAAAKARRTVLSTARGKQLTVVDVAAIEREAGAPMLLIERSQLHDILVEKIDIRFEGEAVAVANDAVVLADGSSVGADAVIGADGIGSMIRKTLAAKCTPRETGFTAIRGIAEHPIEDGLAFEAWGRRELIGAAALKGRRAYWFYEAPSAKVDPDDPLSALQVERWPAPFAELVAATDPTGLLVNRIRVLPRLNTWSNGTTALLGDAAHAMAPNLGQGAAQAIEDAAALGDALCAHRDLARALNTYAESRRDRAHRIQRESDRMARLALSRHSFPRDLLMRVVPDRVRLKVLENVVNGN
jgi:2-polyprenyl-6-methoxyphenol hydroxylase-like FAD-dependent oxidoreductase